MARKIDVIEVARRGAAGGLTLQNVHDVVPPLVYEALASDSAPAAAAALAAEAAIDAESIGRDLLEGAAIVEDDIAFAVVDQDGRRTWLEAGMDGGLTSHSVSKIGEHIAGAVEQDTDITGLSFAIVDEDGRRTWLEADADGKPTARSLELIGAAASGTELVLPTDDWAHWGDSLTEGTWPTILAGMTGRTHYNGGWGGQGVHQIAGRQGGVPARLTLTGNTIPTSGAVTITSITYSPLSNGGAAPGSIAGVAGTLAQDGSGVITFTRSVAGDALTVGANEYFTPYYGDAYRGHIVTLWVGRNGFLVQSPRFIVSRIRAMIDYLSPAVKRVMVMEILPWNTETTGTADRTTLNAANAAIEAAFPEFWLPVAQYLRTTAAATAAGITFTGTDTTDISNGITPTSLRSDGGHPNADGDEAIAAYVYAEAQTRGWL